MSTVTDDDQGATPATHGLQPNHWVVILGVGSLLYLWRLRHGSLKGLLDS